MVVPRVSAERAEKSLVSWESTESFLVGPTTDGCAGPRGASNPSADGKSSNVGTWT